MPPAVLRTASFVFASGLLCGVLLLSGCATAVKVESMPPGAAVTIGGKSVGTTPTQWQVENANKPVSVSFTLGGYFPKTISYTPGSNPQPIVAELEPTKLSRSVQINSEPADGQRVLFVSDRSAKDERSDNNLYIVNADGTNLQLLTTNESDDIMPQWSPTEEGVVYFLSTRGGATNIWRFKVSVGR